MIIRFNFSEGYFILITELLLMRTDVLNYTAFKLGLEMVDNLSALIGTTTKLSENIYRQI